MSAVTREYARRWREANREAKREANRRWRKADREAKRKAKREVEGRSCAAETAADPAREYARRWREANRERKREYARRERERLRASIFAHYGTSCACCGATDRLTIDHVNGGGAEHRAALFGRSDAGVNFYRWLIRSGFPPGYQVLCGLCNSSKGRGERCLLDHAA